MSTPSPVRPILSLCMIVRDNARTIVACLESVRQWVDEIIVVDTGSLDETPQLCRQLGAKVYSFPWIDDFSAARNESLKHATGQWIFWMDSDDTMPAECGRKLREMVRRAHKERVLGYIMQVHCPGPEGVAAGEITVVDHVKLFRNLPDLRFEGRIHEQIIPAIRRLGGEIGWTDIFVVHSGYDHSPEAKERKRKRDLRLLQLELQERPDHPFALFNLGMTYNDMEEHEQAVGYFRRCLKVSAATESHVRKAYALLAASLEELEQFSEAESVLTQGLSHYSKDPELRFRQGHVACSQGKFLEALLAYRQALRNEDTRHFSSIDPGIYGYKARHNLALVYQELSRIDLAEFHWQLVRQEQPEFKPSLCALARSLILQQKPTSAALCIEQLAKQPGSEVEAGILQAELAECNDMQFDAQQRLEELAARYGTRHDVLEARCKFLFHRSSPVAAEAALKLMVERFPRDGAAWNNLASIYLTQGRRTEAISALKQSLAVRPGAEGTQQRLAELLSREVQTNNMPPPSDLAQSNAVHAGPATELSSVRDLQPCHSRRDFDPSRGLFFCAHPRMHAKNNLVTAPVCRVCRFWAQPPPAHFRPFPAASTPQRAGPCRFLGDVVELRECESCRGQVKLKVFACNHLLHGKTTLAGCETCLDYQPLVLTQLSDGIATSSTNTGEPDPECKP